MPCSYDYIIFYSTTVLLHKLTRGKDSQSQLRTSRRKKIELKDMILLIGFFSHFKS